MALVKYRHIFKMAVNSYRQMLTGFRLQAHAMKLDETVIKLNQVLTL